ncbi:hypothetical protein ABZX92_39720, partial [Lentzea sp. NPDC006480]|uniref:hypothetical protein n=1 Tax=Lentzea sp. NPDC006480 TaxID=3157176 RepID=UPI0033BE62F7
DRDAGDARARTVRWPGHLASGRNDAGIERGHLAMRWIGVDDFFEMSGIERTLSRSEGELVSSLLAWEIDVALKHGVTLPAPAYSIPDQGTPHLAKV